jgi:hypothetical protein
MLKNNSIDTKPEYIYEKLKNYNNISDIYYNPLYYEKYNPTLIENKIMFTKIPHSYNNTYKNNGFDDALLWSNEIILHKNLLLKIKSSEENDYIDSARYLASTGVLFYIHKENEYKDNYLIFPKGRDSKKINNKLKGIISDFNYYNSTFNHKQSYKLDKKIKDENSETPILSLYIKFPGIYYLVHINIELDKLYSNAKRIGINVTLDKIIQVINNILCSNYKTYLYNYNQNIILDLSSTDNYDIEDPSVFYKELYTEMFEEQLYNQKFFNEEDKKYHPYIKKNYTIIGKNKTISANNIIRKNIRDKYNTNSSNKSVIPDLLCEAKDEFSKSYNGKNCNFINDFQPCFPSHFAYQYMESFIIQLLIYLNKIGYIGIDSFLGINRVNNPLVNQNKFTHNIQLILNKHKQRTDGTMSLATSTLWQRFS